MPLVGTVGKRRPRARLAMALLYLVLALGAVTTVYPFLLMLTTGFKGPTDQNDNKLVPKYFTLTEGKDETGRTDPGSLEGKFLADKYTGDVGQIASTRIGEDANKEEIEKYERFLMSLPVDYWSAGFRTAPLQVTSKLNQRWQAWLRDRFRTIEELNRAFIEENVSFQTASPPTELLERKHWAPPPGRKYQDWLIFKATLPAEFRIPIRVQRLWQEFLRGKFQGQFSAVPKKIVGGAKAFEQIELAASSSHAAGMREGLGREAPGATLYHEFRRDRLPERFLDRSAEDLWAAFGSGPMPIAAYEKDFLRRNEGSLKGEFATRNYRYALDYLLLNGRALWNTAVFCLLVILTQLIVNPLAAYALSRYPIKSSGRILLFLLATMAFPAEVAMIPNFLLLKGLGLLNTFAALVLPGMASGYMIFLLKGFFDSLPQELFEAGQLDGAKEVTMMTRIALPLSRPVMGYLALLAFMGAYGAFLYAFLVCQDQKMWTVMVWIYQLQNIAPKSVMMAALTLAAVPTLLVFLLAQNVIMRGIVLPGER